MTLQVKALHSLQNNGHYYQSACHNIPWDLTLYLLTWRIWWAPNNARTGQMGYNSAFKGLNLLPLICGMEISLSMEQVICMFLPKRWFVIGWLILFNYGESRFQHIYSPHQSVLWNAVRAWQCDPVTSQLSMLNRQCDPVTSQLSMFNNVTQSHHSLVCLTAMWPSHITA